MFRYRDMLPNKKHVELNQACRPPLPELVLEAPLSVGFYLDLVTEAGYEKEAAAITDAVHAGERAAIDTVQSWVGNKMSPPVRLDVNCTYCRYSDTRRDHSRPHLHLQVSSSAVDHQGRNRDVNRNLLRMSGPVVQVAFAQKLAAEIETATDARFVPARTACRWEIAGLTELAEQAQRWGCRTTSALAQWYPLNKLDTSRTP